MVKEVVKEVPIEVPVEREVIKEVPVEVEVEIVREVHVKEEADKLDDTEITVDEKGHYRIFETVEDPDDPESEDRLTSEF